MAGKKKAAKPGKPPKLDKAARKQARNAMWRDSSFVVRHLARLVLFLAVSLPTLQAFSSGALDPMVFATRLLAAGVFSMVAVGLVSYLVSSYRGQGGPGDDGRGREGR